MPSGIYITKEIRELIIFHVQILNHSAEDIYMQVFQRDPTKISIKYLRKLCYIFKVSLNMGMWYQNGPFPRMGRSQMIDNDERLCLLNITNKHKNQKLRTIHYRFLTTYYDLELPQRIPSISTTWRTLRRADFTNKVMQRKNCLCNEIDGLEFMERLMHINPHLLIDVDETASSPESYSSKVWLAGRHVVKFVS
jgi:hypothetical protein